MGRLIDADALIEAMDKRYNEKKDIVPNNLAEGFMQMEKLIKEQPTAYDVEKVVAELEEAKEKIAKEDYCRTKHYVENDCEHKDCFKCCAEHIIDIVRKGGVNAI